MFLHIMSNPVEEKIRLFGEELMSYIVLLTGIPAAGKTRFSQYLSKELSIPIFSKDAIKEILFDALGFCSREEKVKLGIASMHIM